MFEITLICEINLKFYFSKNTPEISLISETELSDKVEEIKSLHPIGIERKLQSMVYKQEKRNWWIKPLKAKEKLTLTLSNL